MFTSVIEMTRIPLDEYVGHYVEIIIRRGLGDGNETIVRHRGTIIDYDHQSVKFRSIHGNRLLDIRRPRSPRDEVRVVKPE